MHNCAAQCRLDGLTVPGHEALSLSNEALMLSVDVAEGVGQGGAAGGHIGGDLSTALRIRLLIRSPHVN
jgi:hypothetical protein